jgi:Flp pilus assembly protein TadD
VRAGLVQGDTLLLLDLTVTDVATGNAREVISAQGRDLVTLASAAAARLAELGGEGAPGPRVSDLETQSAEAFERYMRALRMLDGLSTRAAAAELDAAIAIDSGFVTAVVERRGLADALGEPHIAARLDSVLDRYAYRASPWVRLTREADAARAAGDVPRTLRVLHELVTRFPRDPRAYAQLASMYGHTGDFERAEAITQQQLALDSLATTVGRGPCAACSGYGGLRVYRTLRGDLTGALTAARRLAELQPELPGAWMGLYEASILAGRYEEADRAFARVLETLGAADANLMANYIRHQIIARRFTRADSLLSVLERDADATARSYARDVRAIYWRELGDFTRANEQLQAWQSEGGDPFVLHMVRGNGFSRLGEYALAEREYRTLLARLPEGPPGEVARMRSWVMANLADAIAPAGDTVRLKLLADSVEYWSRRSYYARDARLPHHIRALVAVHGGRLREARDLFERARWGAHGWTRTNAELARVYERLGDTASAARVRRDALGANLDAMGRYEPRSTFLRELGLETAMR